MIKYVGKQWILQIFVKKEIILSENGEKDKKMTEIWIF